jgi:uncharacterized protein (TIGR03435 family)
MSNLCRRALVFWILSAPAFAQIPARLSFEVATIKPAEPLNPANIASGKVHLGLNVQGSRVDIGFLSLADLIPIAYDVKPFQISGPDWMKTERFDIIAKMPEGATKEQMPEMLKSLLEERFQLKVHRENREHGIYALVVAKGGPKLKDAPAETEAPAGQAADGGITIANGNRQLQINPSRGGATVVTPENGTVKMAMGPEGQMRMEMSKVTMTAFAELLTRFADRPVMDMTELKGNYQVALNLSMEAMLSVARASGAVPAAVLGGGVVVGGRGEPGRVDASDPSGNSSVLESVQQLGLKLDPRKAPVEFVVVDHLERTPSEN